MAAALRTNNVEENLLNREFESHGPRAVLLTYITYIRFRDGFLYLSTILDAYTKEALAHVLSESLEVDFVLETVQIMQRDYGVSLQEETLIHSDQGCHYTSVKFITLVQDLGLRQSMSRRGNCWDNAPQESFYGHMKDELADKMAGWTCFTDVKRDIDDWFDYENRSVLSGSNAPASGFLWYGCHSPAVSTRQLFAVQRFFSTSCQLALWRSSAFSPTNTDPASSSPVS